MVSIVQKSKLHFCELAELDVRAAWKKMGQAGRDVALHQLASTLSPDAQSILTTALAS
jgi:hypothetical protein